VGGAVALGALAGLLTAVMSASSPAAKHPHGGAGTGGLVDVRDRAAVGVLLSPSLDGGQYGWCVGIEEARSEKLEGGGCGGYIPTASQPVTSALTTASARTRVQTIVALAAPQVVAVLVDQRRVPTAPLPGVSGGLRVVRVELPLTPVRSPSGRPGVPAPGEPSLVALDAQGHILPTGPEPTLPRPVTTAPGPCSLRASGLAGLRPLWSHVAGAIAPYPGAAPGQAFFSCIDTEYRFHGSSLDVALLLDAGHPGSPPAAIPGLLPVEGDGAYLNGQGLFKGPLTATRRGETWLVAAGGSGLPQRIELLEHIQATVKLLRGR